MAEWLVEEGIGESRAICLQHGEIVAARLDWPGALVAGHVEDAKLVTRSKGARRGTALFASGEEALVDRLPDDASEGALLRLEVVRSSLAEKGRLKRAQARPTSAPLCHMPSLAERLIAEGEQVRIVRRFPASCDWEGLWQEARSGEVVFAGGSLIIAPTPAMTLIDVDGPSSELATRAIPAIAGAIARFDIGGSIGLDFPTIQDKSERRAIDQALAEALTDIPHERTAMNGFGFVQIVCRLSRPSLLQRLQSAPASAAARLLLRHAERVEEPGTILMRCKPAVADRIRPEWIEELRRRTGRSLLIERDAALALDGGFAQAVTP
ncbi:ribonuclease [Altererythrobacter sp. SALINAS58]|uniref:ribonuclease n=1 Tax=Alteripontixanthobacter muriae TaxID=2705546 RepID=UPI001574F927|nr:ribonuclease [Alteripontixanthobacter muriae]NTZ42541.1 ribonuclease [Alteripontixanthobacter muriae]